MGRDSPPYSCNREMEGQELLLGLAKDKRLWVAQLLTGCCPRPHRRPGPRRPVLPTS